MPRAPRIEYPGAVYHLMCRGDRREAIFLDDWDRERFLDTLGEVCERTGWRIHAYALMGNHYHLLAETPEANLVDGMKWFQGTYTQRFNRRHRMVGHLFQGRYKALLVDGNTSGYFRNVADYIHLNPARAGLLHAGQPDVLAYPWSSAAYFGTGRSDYRSWLDSEMVFLGMGIATHGAKGRRQFVDLLNALCRDYLKSPEDPEWVDQWKQIRRGWCLGDKAFKAEIMRRMSVGMQKGHRGSYSGEEVRRHDAHKAEMLLQIGLAALKLKPEKLLALKKSDERKRVLAVWIRSQTMVSNAWLGQHLSMGGASSVSRYIGEVLRNPSSGGQRMLRRLSKVALEDL